MMRTNLFLNSLLFLISTATVYAQNDVSLYNTWKTYYGDVTVIFMDRPDDDVDMGWETLSKTYPNGDYCNCKVKISIPFDWITRDGVVKMYYNLNGSTVTTDNSCTGGNKEYYPMFDDGCKTTANESYNAWKAGFEPSVERAYSIYGNTLKFDGMSFTAVYAVVQPVQVDETENDDRYELIEIVEEETAEEEVIIQPEKKNGFLTYTWEDGTIYSGNWKDDKRNGFGTVTFTDGSSYAGDWLNDQMHGKGTYTWPGGNKYTGDFKYDRMEGTGTLTTSAGDIYTGGWLANKKHGEGTFKWADGSSYSGQWQNNYFHGRGIFISATGVKQDGEFVEGAFVGAD